MSYTIMQPAKARDYACQCVVQMILAEPTRLTTREEQIRAWNFSRIGWINCARFNEDSIKLRQLLFENEDS